MRCHCALPQVADADFHQAVCSVCIFFQDCGQCIVIHVMAPDDSIRLHLLMMTVKFKCLQVSPKETTSHAGPRFRQ